MVKIKKALLCAPLLGAAGVAVPLASCSIDPKNSVTFEGNKEFVTYDTSFELNLRLQYIMHADQKVFVKIVDKSTPSVFTFKKYYSKYNIIGRRLEYTINFEATDFGSTTFDIEVEAMKNGKCIWSNTIKDFSLIYTNLKRGN